MIDEAEIRRHYKLLRPSLDERGRRLFAATQVRALGHGGLAAVARATGIARSTIGRGLKDLAPAPAMDQRVRRSGGGRKKLSDTDATLAHDLLRLVEPVTLGDPMRPLLWVLLDWRFMLANILLDLVSFAGGVDWCVKLP